MDTEQRIAETCAKPSDATTAAPTGCQIAPPSNAPPSTAPRSKGGAPVGNSNALTHSLRSHRLILGKLTRRKRAGETAAEQQARRSLAKVEQQAADFRAMLEHAVIDVHGSISLAHACTLATAARWERHAMLALRWLRERHDALDDAQRLAFSREIARASAERDKAIERLKLERDTTADAFAAIDAAIANQSTETANPTTDATGDAVDAHNANP